MLMSKLYLLGTFNSFQVRRPVVLVVSSLIRGIRLSLREGSKNKECESMVLDHTLPTRGIAPHFARIAFRRLRYPGCV